MNSFVGQINSGLTEAVAYEAGGGATGRPLHRLENFSANSFSGQAQVAQKS